MPLSERANVLSQTSLVLFAFKQEAFIEEALRSVLAQDPSPKEIFINDDASPDGTAFIIERVLAGYSGEAKIRFIRNPVNLGLARSINNVVSLVTGDIIVVAAGDDISLPARCGTITETFARDPELQCVSSNAEVIDTSGRILRRWYAQPPHERTVQSFHKPNEGLLGATAAYRRHLFELFGPLEPDLMFEDRVLPLRAAIAGKVGYVDEPLVLYREHGSNIWMGNARSAAASMEVLTSYLARENRMMRSVFANRLRDLESGARLYPLREEDLKPLQSATQRLLDHARREEIMWNATGSVARLRATLRAFGGGLSAREAWRWIKLFYLPKLYHRGVQRRNRTTP